MLVKILLFIHQLLAYIKMDVKRHFRRFYVKKGYLYHSNENKHFSKGDYVQTKTGIQGQVWRLIRNVKTGEVVGCIVVWEGSYNGQKYSMLPSENKGKEYNPVIRKVNP